MGLDELTWQEEYQLFLDSEELDEESFEPWYNVQKVIARKEKISRKGRKHTKDDTRGIVPVKKRRLEGCFCATCKKSWAWNHKHLRAEKVFTEEEYYDPAHAFWFDDDIDYLFEVPEDWDAPYELICGRWHTYNEWLSECGMEHLCSDFDWQEYTDIGVSFGDKVLKPVHKEGYLHYLFRHTSNWKYYPLPLDLM